MQCQRAPKAAAVLLTLALCLTAPAGAARVAGRRQLGAHTTQQPAEAAPTASAAAAAAPPPAEAAPPFSEQPLNATPPAQLTECEALVDDLQMNCAVRCALRVGACIPSVRGSAADVRIPCAGGSPRTLSKLLPVPPGTRPLPAAWTESPSPATAAAPVLCQQRVRRPRLWRRSNPPACRPASELIRMPCTAAAWLLFRRHAQSGPRPHVPPAHPLPTRARPTSAQPPLLPGAAPPPPRCPLPAASATPKWRPTCTTG